MTGSQLSRRGLLAGGAGGLVSLAALAACGPAPTDPTGGGKGGGALRWWDHTPNLQEANKAMFAKYEAAGGRTVDYQYYQSAKLGQALTLAKQSEQLPDAFTNVGLELPMPQLIAEGWFQPATLGDDALQAIGDENLIDGIHRFDGEVYTFPIFNPRQYWAANWFNTELVTRAGLDPASPPRTFDEFRAAAGKVAALDDCFGLILNLGQPGRIGEQIDHLAVSAGFEGQGGVLFRTGEFAYDSDPYLQVMEFLVSLHTDKLVMPGSIQFDDKVARQRWATGNVGYYFDGPWCTGSASKDAPSFLPNIGVGLQLVPETGTDPVSYRGPQGGMFLVGGSSRIPEEVSKIFDLIAMPEYQEIMSGGMAQPPLDLDAVGRSDAHPAYKKNVENFKKYCFVGPSAVVRNPDITQVASRITPVKPKLGDIIQGVVSGQLDDWRAALRTLTAESTKAREAAVAEVAADGVRISVDDYAFPNWQPRQDYTKEMYG